MMIIERSPIRKKIEKNGKVQKYSIFKATASYLAQWIHLRFNGLNATENLAQNITFIFYFYMEANI